MLKSYKSYYDFFPFKILVKWATSFPVYLSPQRWILIYDVSAPLLWPNCRPCYFTLYFMHSIQQYLSFTSLLWSHLAFSQPSNSNCQMSEKVHVLGWWASEIKLFRSLSSSYIKYLISKICYNAYSMITISPKEQRIGFHKALMHHLLLKSSFNIKSEVWVWRSNITK